MLQLNYSGSLEEKEKIDKEAWSKHADENQSEQADFLLHKINKLATARKLVAKLNKYSHIFSSSSSILELGGGSCWASYIVKKFYPEASVVGTDLAEAAINSHRIWEPIINSQLDQAYACKSYEIPLPDASFDLVFCFEAAHHFGRHKKTLTEIKRILKPGGSCLYLNEPGCQRFIYPLAYQRVNAKRPEVPEDVLVYKNIVSIAESLGMKAEVIFSPQLIERGPQETIYYYILNKIPVLQRLLPCTIDLKFTKL